MYVLSQSRSGTAAKLGKLIFTSSQSRLRPAIFASSLRFS